MWVRAHRPYRSAIPGAIPPWRDEAETDSYLYYAFGEVRGSTGATANPFRFVGRVGCYDEAELALQYLRARWYRAVLGRFAGRDPLRRGPKLYCYARSRPSAFTDPSGRIVRREEILGKEDLAQLRQFLTPPSPRIALRACGGPLRAIQVRPTPVGSQNSSAVPTPAKRPSRWACRRLLGLTHGHPGTRLGGYGGGVVGGRATDRRLAGCRGTSNWPWPAHRG